MGTDFYIPATGSITSSEKEYRLWGKYIVDGILVETGDISSRLCNLHS